MKEGYLLKSGSNLGEVSAEELKQINTFTRREFQPEELYTFSVALCDNEIDRDFECFTRNALEKLKELFLGRTGIFDHSMKSGGQTARIYDCVVEEIPGKTNQLGEAYCRLVGKAYLPKTAKNEDFMLELDSGIKKEVSVGCAVSKMTCSVCGADRKGGGCGHKKGKAYGGVPCCTVLDEPTDAYEWSFVAVPAQRSAGVIKGFCPPEEEPEAILKRLDTNGTITMSAAEGKKLKEYLFTLEKTADEGRAYRDELLKEVVRLSSIAQPTVPRATMEQVAKRMTVEELKAFRCAYSAEVDKLLPQKPQLNPVKLGSAAAENLEFKI